ncbi:eukaryotic translation initiation factor 2 subunit 3 [Platysternon megacephalum]|uniref:Eukaryotic translation initiation factor 2 subunit 3 n=1 Tax=Platysternon megacephalum TaxID=55544 RepID=A0A4D9EKD4_9SAUR|nr:eukaryotic translation initiation factor 2 subunit 3 [Platysternon megacephalum]
MFHPGCSCHQLPGSWSLSPSSVQWPRGQRSDPGLLGGAVHVPDEEGRAASTWPVLPCLGPCTLSSLQACMPQSELHAQGLTAAAFTPLITLAQGSGRGQVPAGSPALRSEQGGTWGVTGWAQPGEPPSPGADCALTAGRQSC